MTASSQCLAQGGESMMFNKRCGPHLNWDLQRNVIKVAWKQYIQNPLLMALDKFKNHTRGGPVTLQHFCFLHLLLVYRSLFPLLCIKEYLGVSHASLKNI